MAFVFCAAPPQRMESGLAVTIAGSSSIATVCFRVPYGGQVPGGSVSLASHYKGESLDTCAVSSATELCYHGDLAWTHCPHFSLFIHLMGLHPTCTS